MHYVPYALQDHRRGNNSSLTHHYLFFCSFHDNANFPFQNAVISLNPSWRPDLSLIPQHLKVWEEMTNGQIHL